mmetsp:Transcript_28544/g.94722  ORF Transcript_28544/g.94722 Transcript_28544/m.94722 type:complete len:201 (-) Transcript_28544:1163-1765(-)
MHLRLLVTAELRLRLGLRVECLFRLELPPGTLLLVLRNLLLQIRLRGRDSPVFDSGHQAITLGGVVEHCHLRGVETKAPVVYVVFDEVQADELGRTAAAEAPDDVYEDYAHVRGHEREGGHSHQADGLDAEEPPSFLATPEDEAPKLTLAVRFREDGNREDAPNTRDAVHGHRPDHIVELELRHEGLEPKREQAADKADD